MELNARHLILNLLRAAYPSRLSVKEIAEAGSLFAIQENNIRVNLSRLVNEGLLDSGERGSYQLSRQTDAITRFIESWRLGEQRIREWTPQHWLCCYLQKKPAQKEAKSLTTLGFRQAGKLLWVRPDNLALGGDRVWELLTEMGLGTDACLMSTIQFNADNPASWRELWNIDELTEAYTRQTSLLAKSAEHLDSLPLREALAETFMVGGEAIRILSTDPLLPVEWFSSEKQNARSSLTQAMIQYEVTGKQIWSKQIRLLQYQDSSDSHVTVPA